MFTYADWDKIRLVVFDVDGTLYRQRPVRLKMMRDLLINSVLNCDFSTMAVLAKYRRIRERLGNEEVGDFERVLIAETAAVTGRPSHIVRAIVHEWMEKRPLPYLANHIYPGLRQVFTGLRRQGKLIGVLSDYPANAKLGVMGLCADLIVTAGDEGVGFLKPHPQGLVSLMAAAGATGASTMMIGDRPDRDGAVARRVGVQALIKSSKPIEGWRTFSSFHDELFAPFLRSAH
jgi:putative hydrolase of the HAD superfamily